MKNYLRQLGAVLCLALGLHAQVTISGSVSVTGQVVIANGTKKPTCSITTVAEPSGVVGTPYTGATIQTANCIAPLTFSSAFSIPGMTIASGTGVWSGTPTTAGNFQADVKVTDSSTPNQTFTQSLFINIASGGVPGGGHNEYCVSTGTPAFPTFTGNPATRPQTCINTARANTPSPGTTVNVTAGSCTSLQNAITNAVAGQVIVIPALNGTAQDIFSGCTIKPSAVGNDSNWITVKSDSMASLPAEGNRVSPAFVGITSLHLACPPPESGECGRPPYSQPTVAGTYMPKIIGTGNFVIQFQSGASHWRFEGIEPTTPNGQNATQMIQTTGPYDHIIFDQVLGHGGNSPNWQDKDQIQAFWTMNQCTLCALIDSYVGDIHMSGQDAQGVQLGGNSTNATTGLKVTNNFIEASGENIFSGGSGSGASTLPACDVEIRLNHLWKPLFWKKNDASYFGTQFEPKNLLEMKNACRGFVQGNIMNNSWGGQSDQFGNALLLVPKSQANPLNGSVNTVGDPAGTVNWVSGQQFNSNLVSPNCANTNGHANECRIRINGLNYNVVTFMSATQVLVTPAPPAQTAVAFTAFQPGLNPNAQVHDFTIMDNYISGASRVGSFGVAASDGGDVPTVAGSGEYNLGISDLLADNIDGYLFNIGIGACCVWSTGAEIVSAGKTLTTITDSFTLVHSTFIESLVCSGVTGCNPGMGPGFGFGQPTQTLTHITIRDNISAAGWGNNNNAKALWDSWVTSSQLCFDHNWLAKSTFPVGPNGNPNKPYATNNNPPYPGDSGASDNGGCGFPTIGNPQIADFNFPQFTNLNGGVGGNYQLQGGSPLHNLASDGTDPGIIWGTLQNAIAGVY